MNKFLTTIFTTQDGECYTVLQLVMKLYKILFGEDGLQTQINANRESIEDLEAEFLQLKARVTALENFRTTITQTVSNMQTEITGLHTDIEALDEMIDSINAKIGEIETAIDEINGEVL